MSINVYPVPVQTVSVEGTTTTQDLYIQSQNNSILKELKKMNVHNTLITDNVIKDSEVS